MPPGPQSARDEPLRQHHRTRVHLPVGQVALGERHERPVRVLGNPRRQHAREGRTGLGGFHRHATRNSRHLDLHGPSRRLTNDSLTTPHGRVNVPGRPPGVCSRRPSRGNLPTRRSQGRARTMRYHVYLEGEPTLESYRLSHRPREDYAPVFICPFVVLTDGSGRMYNAMRGIQGQSKNETLNMGVYRLDGRLDTSAPSCSPTRTTRSPSATRSPRARTPSATSATPGATTSAWTSTGWIDGGRAPGPDRQAARAGVHVLGARTGRLRPSADAALPPRQGHRHARR